MADLPSFSELQAMSTDPRTAALGRIPTGLAESLSLADVVQERQLERKKKLQEFQQSLKKAKAEAQAAKLAIPFTSTTPIATGIPATLGGVATTQPTMVRGLHGELQPTGQLEAKPTPELPSQLETQRMPLFRKAAVEAEPKEAIKDLLKSSETKVKPQLFYNPSTKTTRSLSPDPNTGTYSTVPGEVPFQIAQAEERAKPWLERNKILIDQLQMRYGFGVSGIASKLGNKLNLGSLKGSDQDASKAYRFSNRGLGAIDQALSNPSLDNMRTASEVAIEVGRVLTGTGVVAQTTINKLIPKTFQSQFATWEEYVTNAPQDANLLEFFKSYKEILNRQKDINGKVVKSALKKQVSGDIESLTRMAPETLAAVIESAKDPELGDITDEVIQEITNKSSGKVPKGTRTSPGGHSYTVE